MIFTISASPRYGLKSSFKKGSTMSQLKLNFRRFMGETVLDLFKLGCIGTFVYIEWWGMVITLTLGFITSNFLSAYEKPKEKNIK